MTITISTLTGIPVHYLAILCGYFIALWIWRRASRTQERAERTADRPTPAALAVSSLISAVVVLLLSGIITNGLLFGEFPGITYLVQHLLIAFVFIYLWSAYVGMGGGGWIVAALMLSLTWACYAIYLGPTGLPDKIVYLTNHQIWSRAFPGDFVAALLGLFIANRLLPRVAPKAVPTATALLALVMLLPETSAAKPRGLPAGASASGEAHQVVGPDPVDVRAAQPANGSIAIKVVEGGNRWSHVQARDWVELTADFTGPGGHYRVVIDKAMPRHPLGLYTTWNGVALNHDMHGETGIGTSKLPLMKPEISLYGWGKVWRDGTLVSPMAAVHAMVSTKGPMPGVMIEVETEEKSLRDVPGGYLTVHWANVANLRMPKETLRNVQILGWVGLIGLTLLFGWLARKEGRRAD